MRFFKLWAALIPVALVLALLVIFVVSVYAITRETDVSLPLFVDISHGEDGPVWDLYVTGIGLSILVLPPVVAAIIRFLSRNDDGGDRR